MFYQEFTSKNKEIQNKLIFFFDKEDNIEENYQNLIELFTNYKILGNKYELRSLLYLISNISNNHFQTPKFRSKIECILQYLKEDIKKNISNLKIFDIFKSHKLILLILINQGTITIDQSILKKISSENYFKGSYHLFFSPEILPLVDKEKAKIQNKENQEDSNNANNSNKDFEREVKQFSEKLPENFLMNRSIGQNDNYICKLIREDLIDEFISYINQYNYPLNSRIPKSIYETNSLLIEYAASFGSIQVFKYLYLNKVKLTPSLWIYGIHSDNPELISILEENHVKPKDKTYMKCLKESIKCHHLDVCNYIQNNYVDEKVKSKNISNNLNKIIFSYGFQYYNYLYFPNDLSYRFIIYGACKYDYYTIVENLLKITTINFNDRLFFFFF